MRFTVIGHACLFIETGAVTLLVDPWLGGSCYWRSWWPFPPNTTIRPEHLAPDYVYVSHHHFDHFHFPSMRRLDRRARVLVPEFAVDVMRHEVRNLGFADVRELPHGVVTELPGGLRLASFQYGLDDSALVVEADGVVLVDLNDCKVKGRAAEHLLRAFGRPTFVFKSHSWAQAYPNCYTAEDPRDLALLDRGDYAASFVDTVREMRPRWAVPFASMVGFLHPETRGYNAYAVTPPEVAAAGAAAGLGDGTVVVMAPGDGWDSRDGFRLATDDPYADRDAALARLAEQARPAIERARADEAARRCDPAALAAYLTAFARAVPLPVRLRLRRPVVFHVPSSPEPYVALDLRRAAVRSSVTPPAGRATIVHIPEGVLADAIANRLLYFVHISLRVSIELAPGGSRTDIPFWGLLSAWEQGYLPLRKVLRPRALRVWWRRRSEIRQLLASLAGRRTLNEWMFGNLMSAARDRAGAPARAASTTGGD